MNRAAQIVAVACLLGLRASASDLKSQLNAALDEAPFAAAQWGVKVCSLDSGATIYARNADKLLKPASNAKIYTAALALDRLGSDFRIRTSCYAAAAADAAGVVHGDLIVYGRGDPSFSARFNNGDYAKAMEPLLDSLAKAGVTRIAGDLVGDDSYFFGPPYGASWTWDDLENYYGAPASALSFQDNVIDLSFKPGPSLGAACQIVTMPETSFIIFSNRTRTVAAGGETRFSLYAPLGGNVSYVSGQAPINTGSQTDAAPVNNPALWFVTMLKEGMARRGIKVSGGLRSANWLDREAAPLDTSRLIEIAAVESRPLAEIVKNTLKPSENLYAQLLLLQVGARASPTASRNTQEAGLAELRRFLAAAGIKKDTVLLEDGSGLARGSLVTPSASVQLLSFMARQPARDAFFDALPIAGVDGTLRNRFKGTPAARNVHAKTGSLQYVNTLSGYLTNKGGEKLVFSIMLNNYREEPGAPSGRAAIDSLVQLLVDSP